MPDDAHNRTTPAREWSWSDNRRRQSSNPTTPGRPPGFRPPGASSPLGYYHSPSLGQHPDALHPSGPPFQGPSLHYPPTGAYPQSGGFYGQYTVPNQPSMNVAQPYSYTHGYQPSTAPDSNLARRDTFQPMVQSQHAPYTYQQRTAEGGPSSSVIALAPASSSSRFSSHPSSPVGTLPQPYLGSGHFAGMAYPSPMGTPQFAYTPHFPATPPMYRSYGPMAYPQHATPAPEEAQGAWFFLSHGSAPPPQQYHYDGGQYQNPYAAQFSPPAVDHGTFPAQPSSRSFQPAPLPTHPGTSQSAQPTSSKAVSTEASSRPASRPPSSAAGSKPVARREWHPRPPPHRSPWVMWVGNVPSDASQDELWDFFSTDTDPGSHESDSGGAVVSIFLIARSNCAFINYSSEETLQEAIKSFHGKRLRPNDPQCPMLVCKIRRSTDDLKSGVGGQRGTGLHMQWVKEQRKLSHVRTATEFSASSDASTSSRSVPDHLIDDMAAVSISAHSRPPRQRTNQSSSSESYASTSSSFLGEHFPTRYFILKSLSERDLELSVESGLWATQKHNELVLDRAYRTSTNVYLIFSVNKSGEFYGYAKMTGPIRQGEGSVSWSSRSHTSPQAAQTLPPSLQRANPIDPRLLSQSDGPVYESPEDFQRTKTPGFAAAPPTGPQPAELGKRRQEFGHYASAPAKLDGPEDDSPERSPSLKFSLDHLERRQRQARQKAPFHLDPKAPFRAMRGKGEVDGILDGEGGGEGSHSHLETVKEGLASEDGQMEAPPAKPSPTWGDCFKVDWVELRKVPFHRTRHLRNAWNKGREIKVSRDGTELESGVGKRLLAEWGELVASDGA